MLFMKNWAKNLNFYPQNIYAPKSEQEIQEIVYHHLKEKKSIRMRGSAHSWTELISSEEGFIHLDDMQGLISVDQEKKMVKAYAGTKLKRFGEEAFNHKLTLPNQGDVNHQSLAGALSTGTHGTGVTLQSMANQLHAMTLINGIGDILSLDQTKDPELLNALSVSLGSAGLITQVSLKMTEAYKLKVESFPEDMTLALQEAKKRIQQNRHFEMFYFPVGQWSIVKLMNQTHEAASPRSHLKKMSEIVLDNWLFEGMNILASNTKKYSEIDTLVRRFVGHDTFIDWSHRAFPTERTVRFMEMEFNLPIDKFEEVFLEIQACIEKNKFETLFPIEIRFVKGDNLWLSPAYQRDSVYFAIHTYQSENYRPYFEEIQKIFIRHSGRPHWGKWHSLTEKELAPLYPRWDDFKNIRRELDPKGIWLNNHLKTLFHN
jgi:FAD-linked oxidoreductase